MIVASRHRRSAERDSDFSIPLFPRVPLGDVRSPRGARRSLPTRVLLKHAVQRFTRAQKSILRSRGGGIGLVVYGTMRLIPSVGEWTTYWRLVGVAVVATVALITGMRAPIGGATETIHQFSLGVSVLALLPVGYALGQDDVRRCIMTSIPGFVAVMLSTVLLNAPLTDHASLVMAQNIMYASVIICIGIPLSGAGASLATHHKP